MLPRGVENLVVASAKSIPTNPRGLIRGQVPCYVMGQVACCAAAVAARSGSAARALNLALVREELRRQ